MNSIAVADPPSQTTISLYPRERADVVLDFSKITTKTTIYLQSRSLQAFVGGTSPSCLTGPCEFGDNVDQTPQPLIKFVVDPTTSAPVPFDPPGGALRSGADAITKVSSTTSDGAAVTERSLLFGFTANLGRTRSPRSTPSSTTRSRRWRSRSSGVRRSGSCSTTPTATTRCTSTTSSSR